MEYQEKARTVIRMEGESLLRMSDRLDDRFSQAVKLIQKSLERGGKVVIIGVGKSGNVGHKIAATLNSTGATAVVLNSQNALHGDLGLLNDGDVVLALSYSGETQELLELLPFLRIFDVEVIAFCGKAGSSLTEKADISLDTSVEREACPLNLAPTSSSTAMMVMGDALAMVLLEARGFSANEFAKYHPGGSLGRVLLLKVDDIMRRKGKFATIKEGATVLDAILEMNQERTGACLIIAESGKLAGIFTQGDFARCYEKNQLVGEAQVAKYMTRDPISLPEGSLAVEAMKLVGENRVDDIVVINEKGEPIGLIDAQDLARNKLM